MDLVLAHAEIENIRAALEWATEFGPELGVRLAVALAQYWVPNSPAEGERWPKSMLDRQPDLPPSLKASRSAHIGRPDLHPGQF